MVVSLAKRAIHATFNKAGYEIIRTPRLHVPPYEKFYSPDYLAKRPFLNVGAGEWQHEHWRNLDFMSANYKDDVTGNMDIEHDLSSMTPIPVPDNSIELIYTSHTIEHIMPEHTHFFFKEAARILAPGGRIRITCPEHSIYYRAYKNGDSDFFPYPDFNARHDIEQLFLYEIASMCSEVETRVDFPKLKSTYVRQVLHDMPMAEAMDLLCSHVDYSANKEIVNHVAWQTAEKTIAGLEAIGLSAYLSGWGQSASPVMRDRRYFDTQVPWFSQYVEAQKPT